MQVQDGLIAATVPSRTDSRYGSTEQLARRRESGSGRLSVVISKENSSDHRVGSIGPRPVNASLDLLPVPNHPCALDLEANQGWFPFWITGEYALDMCAESV